MREKIYDSKTGRPLADATDDTRYFAAFIAMKYGLPLDFADWQYDAACRRLVTAAKTVYPVPERTVTEGLVRQHRWSSDTVRAWQTQAESAAGIAPKSDTAALLADLGLSF